MRIKVLVCAAALAAGALTSMAQSNVYSLNVVGYINLPLGEGFSLIANQLDLDGTGMNNTTTSVLGTNLPTSTTVYTYVPATGLFNIDTLTKQHSGAIAWGKNYPLNPGQGAWVYIPTGALGGGTTNITTVGQVLQGNLTNSYIPTVAGGFAIVSSMVPLSGGLQTGLYYTPQVGETFYGWNPSTSTYTILSYEKGHSGNVWSPSEPQISVGQGFWYNYVKGSSWVTNFTVGP